MRERDASLPLADYAIIGDGRTAALVARDGSIDWLCYARFDGPAVLCRLLDAERGGYFGVAPRGDFTATRRYLGSTNVLATDFACATGRLRVTDFMPLDASDGPAILRRVEGLAGEVEVRVALVPTFDFAREPHRLELVEQGCVARAGEATLRLACPGPLTATGGGVTATLRVEAGQERWLALTHGDAPPSPEAARRALAATLDGWERWAARGHYPGPYAAALRRSALALKLLIHRPSGAMVAAATTSLPEALGGSRNWDYRFMWLRDASWVVSALMELGYHDESMAFIDCLEALGLAQRRPSVFYDLDGRPPTEERELWDLRGWRESRPVRTGNAASTQDQHDLFGEVIAAIRMCSDAMPSMRPLRPGLWALVSALAEQAATRWNCPDRGLWEVRDRSRHFLSSRLLCWAALDMTLAMARRDGLPAPRERWEAEAARLRRALLEEGYEPDEGAFTRALGETGLDASALLVPRYGLLPADDPRMLRTTARVRDELGAGPALLYRYRGPDGLAGEEGAFIPCSFWLAECLAAQGRVDEARAVVEGVLGRASDTGLLSEEIDPTSGELLGNYPQALSHLALIRAAVAIERAEARRRGDVATRAGDASGPPPG